MNDVNPSIVERSWIEKSSDEPLCQGDLLRACYYPKTFEPNPFLKEPQSVELLICDLIVLTQTCDLQNNPVVPFVVLCPIREMEVFEAKNPTFSNKKEDVRKGRIFGFHLLQSPIYPSDQAKALVVDFREVITLPISYVQSHLESLTKRWQLIPPLREHFAQAFGMYFMRVAIPQVIERYRKKK